MEERAQSESDAKAYQWIRRRIGPTRREMVMAWLPWVAVALVVALLGWVFVKPAPPDRVVIAAGPADGAYYAFAKRYADTFAESDVTLDVRATAGTVENYQLLKSGEADLAIVQGGVAAEGLDGQVRAIASLYYEPVWLFVRQPQPAPGAKPELFKFEGKRIALGAEGSGTQAITRRLLDANGVLGKMTAVPLGGTAAADALRNGEVDVAAFVLSPDAPLVLDLLADGEHVRPLSFDRAEAYVRRYRYLSLLTLPRGAIDLARDLPRDDVQLVAPAANLVCRADLHPALIPLAARAAELAHEGGDLLAEPKQFPSAQLIEWPLAPAARDYFASGPPFLQKYLRFWAAALVDRLKYLLLPLVTLALPLMRVAPPLYVWRIRSRIYRWYRIVQELDRHSARRAAINAGAGARAHETSDQRSDDESDAADPDTDLAVLRVLEQELAAQGVPLSYMQEFYNLRLHVDLLRRRLELQRGGEDESKSTNP